MKQCPICFETLVMIDCAPCDDCGWREIERDHLAQGIHVYNVYHVYEELQLTLCNFCDADFSSYHPEYWGLAWDKRLALTCFTFVKQVSDPVMIKDKFCPTCAHRLSFLNVLREVRDRNH